MRLALEVFGLELALTFGPVGDELDATHDPTQLQHVEGTFDAAPDAGDPLASRGALYEGVPPELRRGVGFASTQHDRSL